MIEIFENFDEVEFEGQTPFATSAWVRSALESGSKARIVVWRDERNARSRVICPFAVDGAGRLEFIGQRLADENDIIVEGDDRNLYWALKEICEAVLSMPDVRRVCLEKLPASSCLAAYAAIAFKGSLLFRAVAHSRVRASMPQFKQKDRSRIKALLSQGDRLEVLTPANANLDKVERELGDLADAMRRTGRRGASFWGEAERRVLRSMWQAGLAEVARLSAADGGTEAMAVRFVKARTAWCWMAFCREPKALTRLYARYIKSVAKRGDGWRVDFGSGTYGWKLGMFRPEICPCVTLRWSRTWPGRLGDWLRMAARCLRA